MKKFVANGVDGIWNDMNEPAVFKVCCKSMKSVLFTSPCVSFLVFLFVSGL